MQVQHANLALSSTVYVGNLSFFTTGELSVKRLFRSLPTAGQTSAEADLGAFLRGLGRAEEQIYELFSRVGDVKRIIMGLDRNNKTPCGFCFVE